HYSEKELTLDATARQRDIQPLVVKGKVPLDLDATFKRKAIDPELPLDLTVHLPPSSLGFVPKIVAAVRTISGTAAIDARVSGTVGKPVLQGGVNVKLEYARMKSESIPPIGASQLNLAFTQDSIRVEKVHADLGGGTLD